MSLPILPLGCLPCVISFIFHTQLFLLRLPLFLAAVSAYCLILQWLSPGSFGKKLCLWIMMAILGLWWIDLRIEGVRRGSVAQQPPCRLPHAGSIITTRITSPIDAVYLLAVFDPIFVASYQGKVCQLTLLQAMLHAFMPNNHSQPSSSALTDIEVLLAQHPERSVVVFLEYSKNRRDIAPQSLSLPTIPTATKAFLIRIMYTPPDVMTPVSGTYPEFLWNLLSRPIHCIRVRIAKDVSRKDPLQSEETNNKAARLGAGHNGGSNLKRGSASGKRTFGQKRSKKQLSILSVVKEE